MAKFDLAAHDKRMREIMTASAPQGNLIERLRAGARKPKLPRLPKLES